MKKKKCRVIGMTTKRWVLVGTGIAIVAVIGVLVFWTNIFKEFSEGGRDPDDIILPSGYRIKYFNSNNISLYFEYSRDGDYPVVEGIIKEYAYNDNFIAVLDGTNLSGKFSCIDIKSGKIVKQTFSREEIEGYIKDNYKLGKVVWKPYDYVEFEE